MVAPSRGQTELFVYPTKMVISQGNALPGWYRSYRTYAMKSDPERRGHFLHANFGGNLFCTINLNHTLYHYVEIYSLSYIGTDISRLFFSFQIICTEKWYVSGKKEKQRKSSNIIHRLHG